jgi:pimeloyl-ACP methyl ester carboxylesterase
MAEDPLTRKPGCARHPIPLTHESGDFFKWATIQRMPFVTVESPLATGDRTRIYYRESGTGDPLIFLHGGWGYAVYPFDRQIAAFSTTHRIVIPDRTGYGKSGRLASLPVDFHDRAAEETFAVMDALSLQAPIVWGHSDGAVIAAKMALARPSAVRAVLLEAAHFLRDKPASRAFFESMAGDPEALGERVSRTMSEEHGSDYWRTVLEFNGLAWLALAGDPRSSGDLYGGRLSQLPVPVAVIHGGRDPRTEPGELDALRAALPHAVVTILDKAGHSPHSERAAADHVTESAKAFLASGI